MACNAEGAFSLLRKIKNIVYGRQKLTDTLVYLLDNICIRIDSMLYRQNIGIPMGTNCVPLLLICFYFAMREMTALLKEKRYDMIDSFNSTTRYLDDLLNIDNIHFEQMVQRIYHAELQLNKANASDIEAAILYLNLSIHNDTDSTKIYDKLNCLGLSSLSKAIGIINSAKHFPNYTIGTLN